MSRMARIAPIAIASLMTRTAVGRRPACQACWSAATPPSMLAGADDDPFVADDDPDRRERVAISAQASAGDTVRVQRLDGAVAPRR